MRLELDEPIIEGFAPGAQCLPTDAFNLVIGASRGRNTSNLVGNIRGLLRDESQALRRANVRTIHVGSGDVADCPFTQNDSPFTIEEVPGVFPESLPEWATANASDCIALGKPTRVQPLTGKSYWWLRRLIHKSEIPVMIVPDQHRATYASEAEIRVLLADDLGHGGMSAIRTMAELSGVTKPLRIFHVHVQSPSSPSTAQPNATHFAGSDYNEFADRYDELDWGQSRESIHAQLYLRCALLRSSVSASTANYEAHVLMGNVSDELVRFAHSRRTDVLACGKPHSLRQPPVLSGNISPKFLVTHNAVTIIAPDYPADSLESEEEAEKKERDRVNI